MIPEVKEVASGAVELQTKNMQTFPTVIDQEDYSTDNLEASKLRSRLVFVLHENEAQEEEQTEANDNFLSTLGDVEGFR